MPRYLEFSWIKGGDGKIIYKHNLVWNRNRGSEWDTLSCNIIFYWNILINAEKKTLQLTARPTHFFLIQRKTILKIVIFSDMAQPTFARFVKAHSAVDYTNSNVTAQTFLKTNYFPTLMTPKERKFVIFTFLYIQLKPR